MSSRRWGKFWWQDWQRDPALRMCSLAARGLWIDMLCVMNDSDPQGHFLVNGKRPNDRQMAVIFSSSVDEISSLLSELEDAGVFSKTEDGTIFSRRMVRDVETSEKAKEWGKTGGNPSLNPKSKTKVKAKKSVGVKGGDNPTLEKGVNLHADNSEAEAEAEAEAERKSSLREQENTSVEAALKIPEWVPLEAWNGFVEMRKAIKKPLKTAYAVSRLVKELERLQDQGHDPAEVLDQSTMNSYQGLFPVKADQSRRGSPRLSPSAQAAEDNAIHLLEMYGRG